MMRFGVVSLVVGVFFALALAGCKTDTHSQVQKPPSADANVETEQIVLQVEGLTWSFCGTRARSAFMKVPGVQKAEVDWKKGEAVVIFEKGKVQISQLQEATAKAGYRASVKVGSQNWERFNSDYELVAFIPPWFKESEGDFCDKELKDVSRLSCCVE